jgi:hypothetical protein
MDTIQYLNFKLKEKRYKRMLKFSPIFKKIRSFF